MKDLDLDELDVAVNALMEQPTKQKSKKPAKKVAKKTTIMPHDTSQSPVHSSPVSPEADRVEVTHIQNRLTIPQRNRGMAMDIVQTTPQRISAPSVRASREAPTLRPAKLVRPQPFVPQPTVTAVAPTSEDQPLKQQETSIEPNSYSHDDLLTSFDINDKKESKVATPPNLLEEDDAPHDPAWPDPLDVNKEKPTSDAAAVPTLHADSPEPSPFVSTQVPKRPLGAFTAHDPVTTSQPEDRPEPKDISSDITEEFSPELMAVESKQAPHDQPVVPASPASQSTGDARQLPIPPQYQAAAKPAAHHVRPVFDTETYHHAMLPEHVPHRPHGGRVGIVVAIVLVALVIGGIAYLVLSGIIDLGITL